MRFPIADVLGVTTGRLIGRIDGIYKILNFMTGDNLFTHQLPRAMEECEPSLREQFPRLMEDCPEMAARLRDLDSAIEASPRETDAIVDGWAECLRKELDLPSQLEVRPLRAGEHLHIGPVQELRAMVGDDKVIVVAAPEEK